MNEEDMTYGLRKREGYTESQTILKKHTPNWKENAELYAKI